MSNKASDEILDALHGAFAEELKKRLEDPECSPSTLNVIRQFLKDNGIDAAVKKGSGLGNLADKMKELGADEDGIPEGYSH